jgi:hypothetical protein
MSILDHWDRAVFTGSPFDAVPCLCDRPRAELEYGLVKVCCINPWALHMVKALGFRARYFKERNPRALFDWLCTPPPLRRKSVVMDFANQMRCDLHGYDRRDDEAFRNEVMTALGIAVYLMSLRAAAQQRHRQYREIVRKLPPVAAWAMISVAMKKKATRLKQKAAQLRDISCCKVDATSK